MRAKNPQYPQGFFEGDKVWVLNDAGTAIWTGEVVKEQASGLSWKYLIKYDGDKEYWKPQSMLRRA